MHSIFDLLLLPVACILFCTASEMFFRLHCFNLFFSSLPPFNSLLLPMYPFSNNCTFACLVRNAVFLTFFYFSNSSTSSLLFWVTQALKEKKTRQKSLKKFLGVNYSSLHSCQDHLITPSFFGLKETKI